MEKINSLSGMLDLISNKADKSEFADKIFLTEKYLKKIFQNYGMSEIRTPALEDTSLFKRSVGDASDIVNKELYSFNDKNDKNIVLRPEGTAGVIRAIIQKKIDLEAHQYLKCQCAGPTVIFVLALTQHQSFWISSVRPVLLE